MTVVLLDPRFPSMIPVDAIPLMNGDISYTEEVPVRVRWVVADLGGSTVFESDVLVTTNLRNEHVIERLEDGDELITAPSLLVHLAPDREIDQPSPVAEIAGPAAALPSPEALKQAALAREHADEASLDEYADAADEATRLAEETIFAKPFEAEEPPHVEPANAYSGQIFVEGEVLSADEHTAAVAAGRRDARTDVPSSVIDELEDAVALMARALRQGEWEQSMTHESLLPYLKEETDELAATIKLRESLIEAREADSDDAEAKVPEWAEQDLCDELSDILLQVLFHAELANRRGAFDIGHVAGAFVQKLNARAPYLFDDVEELIGTEKQEALWAEGKQQQLQSKIATYGDDYADYLDKKTSAQQKAAAASTTPAAAVAEQGTGTAAKPKDDGSSESTGHTMLQATVPRQQVDIQQVSMITLADDIIREARELGLSDVDIPTDIRYPMLGLELDKPGDAEDRLRVAVEQFRERLNQMES